MRALLRTLGHWLRRHRADAELAAEIETHRAMAQDALEARGSSAEDAARESRRSMGNVTLAREEAREVWIARWIDSLARDLRYAVRSWRRQPGFTATAILTLGVATGVITSVFTAFNALYLRPWPVPQPDRVFALENARMGWPDFSLDEYRYLASNAKSFSGLVAVRCLTGWTQGCELDLGGRAIGAAFVSDNFFSALSVPFRSGRGFSFLDDDAVAVISEQLASELFGDAPAAGSAIDLDGKSFAVVGVVTGAFTGTRIEQQHVWLPLAATTRLRPFDQRIRNALTRPLDCCATIAGRLAAGVDPELARSEIENLSHQYRLAFASAKASNGPVALVATSLFPFPGDERRLAPVFAALFLASLLLLLLAYANVANLLLARGEARRREFTVRLSLGAGRARLVRQLLTESLSLAIAAAAVGFAVAWAVPQVIAARTVGATAALAPDTTVLTFTAGVALVTCLAFGLLPAWRTTAHLVMSSSHRPAWPLRWSLRSLFLAAQVAVSVLLLAASSLMLRGLDRAIRIDPGFTVEGTSVLTFALPPATDPAEVRAFAHDLIAEAPAATASAAFAFTSGAPFSGEYLYSNIHLPGASADAGRTCLEVSPSYFSLLHIRVLAGRAPHAADAAAAHRVVVNQAMAEEYWPGANPIGRTIMTGSIAREVVGVVGNANADADVLQHASTPVMYLPFGSIDDSGADARVPAILVRTADSAAADAFVALARRLSPRAVAHVVPLPSLFADRVRQASLAPALAGALGLLALLLTSVGIFSVCAYRVQQRRQELGIRLALGASRTDLIALVAMPSVTAIGVGLAVGLAGAAGASRVIRRFMYGLGPFDPIAYGAVALALFAAGCVASYGPVRRALRVDPATTLRAE